MNKLIFITGGAASGKSTFACGLASEYKDILFVATGQKTDIEMKEKIRKHQLARPKTWQLLESGDGALDKIISAVKHEIIIIDCLTFYTATQLIKLKKDIEEIACSVKGVINKINKNKNIKKLIIVSNEVGMGVVPATASGRIFREALGTMNKIVMREANEAYLMVSGQPIKIK